MTAAAPTRFLWIAVASEAGLGVVAVFWILGRGLPLRAIMRRADVGIGVLVAVALALVNLGLLRYGPDVAPLRSVRRFYRRVLRPLFGRLGLVQIVILNVATGVGEELLFRGAFQAEWGMVMASLLFGLVHIGSIDMVAFGVWAGSVGALLGWLAIVTDGLLAPITAHAVYDALALAYIVWVPAASAEQGEREEPPR